MKQGDRIALLENQSFGGKNFAKGSQGVVVNAAANFPFVKVRFDGDARERQVPTKVLRRL
ncbi:hypothetical protein [Plesiocystis pacifica]|uniref:hypothetical protein n=1 Tax=Plesiocystis pacifica TaxID=191768 RepID=UPI0012F750AC|nr:hypothetical protein [Plesiocystis pacifica]